MRIIVVASFIAMLAFSENLVGELGRLQPAIELSPNSGPRQVPCRATVAVTREGFEPPKPIHLGFSRGVQMTKFGEGDFKELESAKEDLKKMYEYLGKNQLDQVGIRIESVRKKIDDYERRHMQKLK